MPFTLNVLLNIGIHKFKKTDNIN